MILSTAPWRTEILERDRNKQFTGNISPIWVRWLGDFVETLQSLKLTRGTGSPQGIVTGNPGDLYVSNTGGAGVTLWVKESGVLTATGWVAK